MIRIAILASGSGTNAENIIRYFKNHSEIEVSLVLSNKQDAKVLQRAESLQVSHLAFNREDFMHSDKILQLLMEKADWIILAGFLWKVPQKLIAAFSRKMINIHPALLPKYGGKGMFGMHVHNAVVENKEKSSGITIHYVNENYDEGAIIFQQSTELLEKDTPEDVAKKIHMLEYLYFPQIIEKEIRLHG